MAKTKRQRILIANGVNLDLLGVREPEVYGHSNLAKIEQDLRVASPTLSLMAGILEPELVFFQSNNEALFLEELSRGWDGAVINPGAWTHTSLALADRLLGLKLPFVEVHLSNLAKREAFRQHSYCSAYAIGVCSGFGPVSYLTGLLGLYAHLAKSP